ncbi:MAG TPA: glycosyltransferase family 2 protein [Alloacidobacterium sp.]|nr:glycosyltransferase family 2 protein [Alloacidobacterium sp.]
MLKNALVSVVIPTHNRPLLVMDAVASALAQTYAALEVIVVIDGSDSETFALLQSCSDLRLKIIYLNENVGGAEARNIGARAACGEWIAFLDDDDTWLPEKLEKQLACATIVGSSIPIVSSSLIEKRNGGSQHILPRRLYQTGEDVSEYLFCRRSFAYGDGMLQTSTLLTRRSLLLDIPFQKGLRRHQDWDWLLRAVQQPDVAITMLSEPLTIMRVEEQGQSVSRSVDWETSFVWAERMRPHMTPKAYSFFLATECITRARKSGAGLKMAVQLFRAYLRNGRPSLRSLCLFLGFFAMPPDLQRWRRKQQRQNFITLSCEQFHFL